MTNPEQAPLSPKVASQVGAPPKPWWKSITVQCAAAAGGCMVLNGVLEAPALMALIPTDWDTNLQMLLQGAAFVLSGGAIKGRFMAKLPIR